MSALPYHWCVPLAVPYWNGATYSGILRSFLSSHVIDGPDLSKLQSLVIEALGVDNAVLCGSGSLAIEIALRACGVGQDDEVVIPTFCCAAVVAPILAVGALPVLADTGEELNITAETIEAVLTRKTRAILVPHLFGNPADINIIVDRARTRKIHVIDDAAQALGATINGQPVGSFGDAGILSFGSEKVCFGLGGGVVVSRNEALIDRFLEMDLIRPQFVPTSQKLLSTIFWRRWRRWTLPVRAALSLTESAGPDLAPSPYRQESMANVNAAVASSLMQTLRENIAARRSRVKAYQELLGTVTQLTLITHRPDSACLTQVVRILSQRHGKDVSAHLIEVLASAGYEVQGSYVPIHLLPYCKNLVRRPLPHAERIWQHLVELPCEPDVSFDHVERIAAIVKRVVSS